MGETRDMPYEQWLQADSDKILVGNKVRTKFQPRQRALAIVQTRSSEETLGLVPNLALTPNHQSRYQDVPLSPPITIPDLGIAEGTINHTMGDDLGKGGKKATEDVILIKKWGRRIMFGDFTVVENDQSNGARSALGPVCEASPQKGRGRTRVTKPSSSLELVLTSLKTKKSSSHGGPRQSWPSSNEDQPNCVTTPMIGCPKEKKRKEKL